MQLITTTLKREWFAQIVEGTKRIEYREIKPYWTERLRNVEVPFVLVLRNGMRPPVPVVRVRIDRVTPSPQGKATRGDYALHIGKVLKVEHWDRRNRAPKSPRVGSSNANQRSPGQVTKRLPHVSVRMPRVQTVPARISVRRFRAAIQELPAAAPIRRPGVWYLTQKEHWLGWLKYYNTEGAYGRIPGTNRDARYAYNHVVCPPMLLWLVSASGVDPRRVRVACAAIKGATTEMAKAGAIRREVPWDVVAEALWPKEKR